MGVQKKLRVGPGIPHIDDRVEHDNVPVAEQMLDHCAFADLPGAGDDHDREMLSQRHQLVGCQPNQVLHA